MFMSVFLVYGCFWWNNQDARPTRKFACHREKSCATLVPAEGKARNAPENGDFNRRRHARLMTGTQDSSDRRSATKRSEAL